MPATAAETKPEPEQKPSAPVPSILVVDIRKRQSRKKIRQLRKGKGRLMSKVNDTVQDLCEQNGIKGNVQPVVIVVRQKARRWRLGRLGI